MTGLELMSTCGYDISHLTESDSEEFWMEMMRLGFTGPREPMEAFAEQLRAKRIQAGRGDHCICDECGCEMVDGGCDGGTAGILMKCPGCEATAWGN